MSKTATIIALRDGDTSLIAEGASRGTIGDIGGSGVWAGPRPCLENDPTFRQVIPYIVLKNGDQILVYVRASTGGESRLHGRGSIGLGGHIDLADMVLNLDGAIDLECTIAVSARREIYEELGVALLGSELKHVGFVKVSETDVDKVHIGFVMLWDLSGCQIPKFTFEDTVAKPEWMTREQLTKSGLELESWSKLALDLI